MDAAAVLDAGRLEAGVRRQRLVGVLDEDQCHRAVGRAQPVRPGGLDDVAGGAVARHPHQRDLRDALALEEELDLVACALLGHRPVLAPAVAGVRSE